MDLGIEHKFSRALPLVTVSQGICWGMLAEGNLMWDFLHAADDLLYMIKKRGRNNYCIGDIRESDDMLIGEKTNYGNSQI